MLAWEAIQKTIDYIDDYLAKKHTPEELALSRLCRLFIFSGFLRGW